MDVRGVLFDWRGTLAVSTTDEEWAAAALRRLGRPTDAEAVGKLAPRLAQVADELDGPGIDSDADLHRRTYHRVLAGLGLDPELVAALYEVESDPACNVFAEDAAHTVTALRDAGLRIGVVSDIHVDIRPAFAAAGIPVDVFTLSFEQGVQKPAPEM
ncbi:MAG: HAD family hydrolase, partial [Blastococcus sp.]